ncbi:MAG: TraB/GumN family protein [Elusimicrobia bacterium]|nr:TraB/GumN family protein [Elusimicrobiota bacterium]
MAHDSSHPTHDDSAPKTPSFSQEVPFFPRSLGELIPRSLTYRAALVLIIFIVGRLALAHFADNRYTMMWEVTDGARTGHVLGTIHAGKDSVYPMDPAILEAFDRARLLSFEIKLGKTKPRAPSPMPPKLDTRKERELLYRVAALQIRRDPAAWLAYQSQSISDRRAEAYRRSLYLTEKALPINGFDTDRAVIELSGYSFKNGIERHLFGRAGFSKPILAAEPNWIHNKHGKIIKARNDYVFDPFEPDTLDRAIDEAREVADWVWEDWREGRVGDLDKADRDYNIMVRRNRAMAHTFHQLLKTTDRPFMAVGYAHLGGKEGLIAILKSSGLTVKRVRKQRQEK